MFEKLVTELKLRGSSDKTIKAYIFHNQKFLDFIKKDPESVTQDDIKEYLAYLISDKGQRPSSVNLALSSLKFYYLEVLKKKIFEDIKALKKEKKMPTVLTKEEIKKLIAAPKNFRHRLVIKMLYSSGLRVNECVNLKVNDLNFEEKLGIVRTGKGKKDRNMILSEDLINDLRKYLKKRKRESEYVFDVKSGHLSVRQAQKIINDAAKQAEIKKRVFCHALRSSFATHLHESGVDIRIIQELLGHSNLQTTQIYTTVSTKRIKEVKSPLDDL